MTERDFCYWLQGFFELSPHTEDLNEEQTQLVKKHLYLVFEHRCEKVPLQATARNLTSKEKEALTKDNIFKGIQGDGYGIGEKEHYEKPLPEVIKKSYPTSTKEILQKARESHDMGGAVELNVSDTRKFISTNEETKGFPSTGLIAMINGASC